MRSCSPSRYSVSTVSSVRQTIRRGGNWRSRRAACFCHEFSAIVLTRYRARRVKSHFRVCFEQLSAWTCPFYLAAGTARLQLNSRKTAEPQFDSVEHCFVCVFLGDARPLQDLEGVVPTFHDVKIGGSFQLFDDRPQLVR